MTFEDAFSKQVAHVNDCYAAMRAIIADPEFNNTMNHRWRDANEKFQEAISAVFALKDTWLTAKELLADKATA